MYSHHENKKKKTEIQFMEISQITQGNELTKNK